MAKKAIEKGELVLREAPLFALPESFDDVLLNETSLSCLAL